MKNRFEGLNVVVTGANGSLGAAVVRLLRRSGASCFLPLSSGLRKENSDFADDPSIRIAEGVNLAVDMQVNQFYSGIPELWASIHCVGGFSMQPFVEATQEELETEVNRNLKTCFLCCREAVRLFQSSPRRDGRIVNIAARPALEPRSGAGMVCYTVSKAAVSALTVSLGEELAGSGILVNAVAPSVMNTPANRSAMSDADHGKWPTVEDVASTIVFLASRENRVTRSAVVPVYGAS